MTVKAKQPKSPRTVARLDGDKMYQGEPCVHGHDGTRYTSSGMCVTCNKANQTIRQVRGETAADLMVRYKALQDGYQQYQSEHYCTCGNLARWVKSGYCADCFSSSGTRVR